MVKNLIFQIIKNVKKEKITHHQTNIKMVIHIILAFLKQETF